MFGLRVGSIVLIMFRSVKGLTVNLPHTPHLFAHPSAKRLPRYCIIYSKIILGNPQTRHGAQWNMYGGTYCSACVSLFLILSSVYYLHHCLFLFLSSSGLPKVYLVDIGDLRERPSSQAIFGSGTSGIEQQTVDIDIYKYSSPESTGKQHFNLFSSH